MSSPVFLSLFWYLSFFVLLVESKTSSIKEKCLKNQHHRTMSIGVVIDEGSRVGREQRIALEMAVHDHRQCSNLVLHFKESYGNSASAALELILHKRVHAIILATITHQEAALLATFNKSITIISISPTPSSAPQYDEIIPSFIQMGREITYQIQCTAAIIKHFHWRKVITIAKQCDSFSSNNLELLTLLSDELRPIGTSVEHHLSFPCVSSLILDTGKFVEEKLKSLRSRNVRVFVVIQSSLGFCKILFEKAKLLGMMGKGFAWIVSDEIANLIDSVNPQVMRNMEGVIGLKLHFIEKNEHLKEFKIRFRKKYGSKYLEDEEILIPSIYSLRAYDTTSTIATALQKSEKSEELATNSLSSDYEGLSGRLNFENGLLAQKPIFRIVNVIGRSYIEVALWSPEHGFEVGEKGTRLGNGLVQRLNWIYWPGGERTVPNGWTMGSVEKPLRIGVPARGAFNHFVKVINIPGENKSAISGFSIDVFEAAVKQLPYRLYYEFVPYYDTYDEMVTEVHNKSLDAAVGDTEIMAYRYVLAEFSQPYIESGLQMVVTLRPGFKDSGIFGLNAFTNNMWFLLAAVSVSTGATIWLSEYASGNEQFRNKSFHELISSVLCFIFDIPQSVN